MRVWRRDTVVILRSNKEGFLFPFPLRPRFSRVAASSFGQSIARYSATEVGKKETDRSLAFCQCLSKPIAITFLSYKYIKTGPKLF